MIVFDASSLVSAAFRPDSIPNQAVRLGFMNDQVGVSMPVLNELLDVLHRPRLARFINPEQRADILGLLETLGKFFSPTIRITDCRDAKDNKYLELALASGAATIVSSDMDLLVLHPWRGVKILRPVEYLDTAGPSSA